MPTETIYAMIGAIAGVTGTLGAAAKLIRYAVRAELTAFELSLLQRLNGTYIRADSARAENKAVEDRIDRIERYGCARFINHLGRESDGN